MQREPHPTDGAGARPFLRIVVTVCVVGLLLPLLWPIVTGRLHIFDDLGTLNIPLRYVYSRALQSGDSLLWSPSFYSGFYLFGEGQTGMAHPLHLVLYRWFPLHIALSLEMASSYLIAFAGGALLLQRLGLSREASWVGAMTFAFGGFNLLHAMHVNMVDVIAEAPWLLLAAHVLLTSDEASSRALGFAGVALLLGSQLLLGHPQMVWMTFIAVGFLVLCLLRVGLAPGRLLWLVWALALGTLIGGVQLLPTLDVLRASTRSNPSLMFRLRFSLSPLNLVQLWSPYTFRSRVYATSELLTQELGIYNSAFCSVALGWLVARWSQLRHRALTHALLAVAGVSLVLALGSYGGVYPWLARLPGVSAFRAPARHVVLFQMALAGLAAVAFEDLLVLQSRHETVLWRRLRPLVFLAGLVVATTLMSVALVRSGWAASHGVRLASAAQSGVGAAMLLVVIALVSLAAGGRRWALPAIVVVTALDLGAWGYFDLLRAGSATIETMAATAPVPPQAGTGDSFEAEVCSPGNNWGVLRDLKVSTGCLGLMPAAAVDPETPLGLTLAGVQWRRSGNGWERASALVPRARLVSMAVQSRDVVTDASAVDIERVALVAETVDGLAGVPGAAQVLVDRPGLIQVRTSASGRQLLVTTERFNDGWQARDAAGGSCRTLRVDGDFLGCVVEAGEHDVTFTFAPAGVRIGAMATAAGLLLTALTVLVLRKPRGTHAAANAVHRPAR